MDKSWIIIKEFKYCIEKFLTFSKINGRHSNDIRSSCLKLQNEESNILEIKTHLFLHRINPLYKLGRKKILELDKSDRTKLNNIWSYPVLILKTSKLFYPISVLA